MMFVLDLWRRIFPPKPRLKMLYTQGDGFVWVRTNVERRGAREIEQWQLQIERSPVLAVWFHFEGDRRWVECRIMGTEGDPVPVASWGELAVATHVAVVTHAGEGLCMALPMVLRPLADEFNNHLPPNVIDVE